jgi:Eph receptor B1
VYYVNCPNVTVNLARFVETPTGREPTEIVPAEGTCVENAVQVDMPRLLCKGDGNWTLPSGGCKCMAGYQQLGQTCQGTSISIFLDRVQLNLISLWLQNAAHVKTD